jgi:hypothetical protein
MHRLQRRRRPPDLVIAAVGRSEDDRAAPGLPTLEDVHIYSPADRPDVEVLVDDTWHPDELRGWWGWPGLTSAGRGRSAAARPSGG